MKKYILTASALLLTACLFSCGTKKMDMDELFDEKPSDTQNAANNSNDTQPDIQSSNTQPENSDMKNTEQNIPGSGKNQAVNNGSEQSSGNGKLPTENKYSTDTGNEQMATDAADNKNNTDIENIGDTSPTGTDDQGSTQSAQTQIPSYTLSENEIQNIKSRYIEAEDFYYTMLYQRYDLDSYDVIEKKNSDGYSNQYHRVLYYDVNSLADLKSCYTDYFTADFVASINFNSYVEENGKLYCMQIENAYQNSSKKHIYSVESVNSNTAFVVRTLADGSSLQRIKAVKANGQWFFDGVAIE